MTRVGYFRATWHVARKDLQLEWRTLETLSSSFVFSLIVLVIFNFAFGFETIKQIGAARLVPGVVWTVLAFGAVVSVARSMEIERRRDTLSALFIAPIDRGALFTGKFLANLVKNLLLQWIVVVLAAVFFNFDLVSIAGPMLLVLFVHGLGLTELGTLFAAVASRVGRGEALLATLLFPATAPLFISAVKCTTSLLEGNGLSGAAASWLSISTGFDVLYFLVALATFEFVLEE
ncbi:MAG TPA: heme exporter protein CcmB [Candidatus Polarisedimenticolaceae bacterium]|nr:heme exporter protein CcmB [Candidatus Polarisedimenticolaceae bacterium]